MVGLADTYSLAIRFCSSSLWIHARSPPMVLQKSLASNHVCIFSLPPWKIYRKWAIKYCVGYYRYLETQIRASIFLLIFWSCSITDYLIVQPFSLWLSIQFNYCFFYHLRVPVDPKFSSLHIQIFLTSPSHKLGDGWIHVTIDCLSSGKGKIHLPCTNKIYSYLNGKLLHSEMKHLLWSRSCSEKWTAILLDKTGEGLLLAEEEEGSLPPPAACRETCLFLHSPKYPIIQLNFLLPWPHSLTPLLHKT